MTAGTSKKEWTVDNLTAQPMPVINRETDITAWNLVPFLVSDRLSGRILQVNEQLTVLTGHSRELLEQMTVMDLGLWPSLTERTMTLDAQPGATPTTRRQLRTAQGTDVPVVHGWQVATTGEAEVVSELLVDMSQAAKTQERLERLNNFRSVLAQVLRESLNQGLDADFYQRVLQKAVDTIPGAQTASLLVRSGDGRFRFHAAIDCDLDILKTVSFTEEQMVLGRNGEPVLHYGYSDNITLPAEARDAINASGPTSEIKVSIVAPVMLDGEPVAVFNLDNLEDAGAFEEESLSLAMDYAQHLAVLLQRFKFEEALWQQANLDKLTGLPNRRSFDELMKSVLHESDATGVPVAAFFIDLDQFKSVNDMHGHAFGDQLVRAVTDRLSALLPDSATLARWGGDELVAIIPGANQPTEVEEVARRLVAAGADSYTVGGMDVNVTLSIGIALYPEAGTTAQNLLQNADAALYSVKQAGKNGYRVFDDSLRQALQLRSDIRTAAAQGDIHLHYQPRYNLAGRLMALEALARWQHPVQGLLPASRFIPVAEEAGLIQQLGLQLLDEACAQARRWLDEGLHAPIAYNMSGLQLASPLIAQQVEAILRRHALPAHLLEIQIAETAAVVDVSDTSVKLMQLRRLGIRLLLDDIGSGFSNLAILRRFQLDGIKISRDFISQLEESTVDSGSEPIVTALVDLGRDLGVQIIAEGVETNRQLKFLRAAGVTQVQGFLFSHALPAEQVTVLLKALDSGM